MGASDDEAREFAAAFRGLMEWVSSGGGQAGASAVVNLVRGHLGPEWAHLSVVSRVLPLFEQVNLQTALGAWSTEDGRSVQVQGFSLPPHYSMPTLQQLLSGEGLAPMRLSAPDLVDLPSGPGGQTLACFQHALLLVEDGAGRYVVLVSGPERHQEPALTVEVAGLDVTAAQQVHADLARLRSELNVYRGQVLDLTAGPMGGLQLSFADLPTTTRSDVVLPEDVLRRIERHTVDIAAHRQDLLAAGQHLKRGLLLFGPPGTGKTHTTRYLIGRLRGCTVLLLSGNALHLIGSLTEMARELQPTVLVLEDVDLVAEDRGFGPGSNPVLFELLDAMDGAAADADLLFLLTTNRADLLEPALAARPGRVDVAVEIDLPDADARRRLFELYSHGVPLSLAPADVDRVVTRTEGTTASFLKELVRRAVLESLSQSRPLTSVSANHVDAALDDLLDSSQHITRALLGVGGSSGDGDAVPTGRVAGGHGAMTGYRAMPGIYRG
jgi:cell division protease FtsH